MSDETPVLTAAMLRAAAQRFAESPAFVGYWLEVYREREGLELPALAARLGCSVETVQHLSLCRQPRAEQWADDTAEIAQRYGIEQDRLADLLLDAEAYAATRRPATAPAERAFGGARAAFAAARDREPEPDLHTADDGEAHDGR
jgi:hypothetical protein